MCSTVSQMWWCACRDLLERAWSLFLKHGLASEANTSWPSAVEPALQVRLNIMCILLSQSPAQLTNCCCMALLGIRKQLRPQSETYCDALHLLFQVTLLSSGVLRCRS